MPFGLWAWMGPRIHVLDGGPDAPYEGQFRGKWAPIVKYSHELCKKWLNRCLWWRHHDQSHYESLSVSSDECRLSAGWPPTLEPSRSLSSILWIKPSWSLLHDFATTVHCPQPVRKFGPHHAQIWGLPQFECVHCLGFRWPKTTILGKFGHFWGSCTNPFYLWEPNLVCYSRPTVYTYTPNFVSIGLLCPPLAGKNPNFCRFLDFGI